MRSFSSQDTEIVVFHPRLKKDAQKVLEVLQQRKPIMVNLGNLSSTERQRFVDWVSGGINAIDGRIVWIGNLTFLFVPSHVKVSGHPCKTYSVSPNMKAS